MTDSNQDQKCQCTRYCSAPGPDCRGLPWTPAEEAKLAKINAAGVREFPEQTPRVESGPVQFGQDWPGIFMRGDHALPMAMYLGLVLKTIEQDPELAKKFDMFTLMYVKALQRDLQACNAHVDREPK